MQTPQIEHSYVTYCHNYNELTICYSHDVTLVSPVPVECMVNPVHV